MAKLMMKGKSKGEVLDLVADLQGSLLRAARKVQDDAAVRVAQQRHPGAARPPGQAVDQGGCRRETQCPGAACAAAIM